MVGFERHAFIAQVDMETINSVYEVDFLSVLALMAKLLLDSPISRFVDFKSMI